MLAILFGFILLVCGIYAMYVGYNCAVVGAAVLATIIKGIFRR